MHMLKMLREKRGGLGAHSTMQKKDIIFDMDLRAKLTPAFKECFGTIPPLIVRAPGRVNLIGEHTDYNDGFVLPMALDRAVWIALRRRRDRQVIVHSLDFDASAAFSLDQLQSKGKGWIEYLRGIAWALQKAGYALTGWEGVMVGDVPVGAGLSSSAATELAAARAFVSVSDLEWDAVKMAGLGQKAENEWVGVNCGIMDQMASAAARAGHALFLDCRSLTFEHIPLPDGLSVVVLDTATRRGLLDSAYNERRLQCKTAARLFGVRALRDVDMRTFEARGGQLGPLTYRRARHVIRENDRVTRAVAAMRGGDLETLGRLLVASHASLRDDFEVSSQALNIMVEIACQEPGCFGARMTGAGFGGCAVALVQAEKVQDFAVCVAKKYAQQTGLTPNVYICQAVEGAGLLLSS
ncbi:MAG: galactokinase [Anaerolineales bacterium]|nr:galactokinase [Anaerolineales bacterium]